MLTRELLTENQADIVLRHGFKVADAESLLTHAPLELVQRIAREAGIIDRVTIWEADANPADAWALTMPNTKELLQEWCDGWLIFQDVEELNL